MPLYRFTRFVQSDAIEVEADSPEEAEARIAKEGIVVKGEFTHTRVEEIQKTPTTGYVLETTRDVLEEKKRG